MKEWNSEHRPSNRQEIYNLLHSVKRASRVEVAIGLLKSRFKILQHGVKGKAAIIQLQTMSCAHLHNYIQRRYGRADESTAKAKLHGQFMPVQFDAPTEVALRDRMADEAFQNYKEELERREDPYLSVLESIESIDTKLIDQSHDIVDE